MFELIFLGTSASAPSANRGLSAHILMYRQHRFLIDCGEGTQRQILRSGLGFKRLNKILLTHSHLDHILGLGGLVSTLARWDTALEDIEIYGGASTLKRVYDLLHKVVLRGNRTPVNINFIEINPGDTLVEDKHFKLTAFKVDHRGPDCLGFVFEEKTRRPFLAEKADALGIPFGPERSQLVAGKSIALANGQVITPDMVLGEALQGTKYVHIGDIGRTAPIVDICRNAHALTIEATYTTEDREMARQFGHMTAADAARFAIEANISTLLLTHISRRYFERDIRNEARAIFPNAYIARDFDHFQISRDGITRTNLLAN